MKHKLEAAKQAAIAYIEENKDLFTGVSHEIWEHPELSLQEHYAASLYIRVLREHGFTVTEKLGGIDTAFMGSFGHGKPVIGLLGEFDALSGLSQKAGIARAEPVTAGGNGHGCGHNMLGAGDLAAAFAVKDYLERTGRSGTVVFFGCPGEEGGAAKAFLARDRFWRKLDAALTWHPSDVNEVVTGTNHACIQVLYHFYGCPAHAASDPYNGRSALDAVELMNVGVQFLREHMKEECRIHYAITDAGGVSPNVVQARASVLYMVRARQVSDCVRLQKRVDAIAQGAALMTETTFKRVFIDGTAELVPNFCLEELLHDNFCFVGLPSYTREEQQLAREIMKTCPCDGLTESERRPICDYIAPLVHSTDFNPGSSDVGDVGWQTPTAQIHAASFAYGSPGHSWQNVSAGGSSIGDKSLLLAGKVLACTAIDLFEDGELLQKARDEFEARTAGGYVCPIEDGAVPVVI